MEIAEIFPDLLPFVPLFQSVPYSLLTLYDFRLIETPPLVVMARMV